jgi:hypothetical protein
MGVEEPVRLPPPAASSLASCFGLWRLEALPVACGLPAASVHHEVLGALGDLGVEVVHQHAEGSFLSPALAGELAAPWRTHRARLCHVRLPIPGLRLGAAPS